MAEELNNHISHVLLDLDGTLADTAGDLSAALNHVLMHRGHEPMPLEEIRPTVSLGGVAMVRQAFNIDESHGEFETIRTAFLDYYSKNLAEHTVLFPGMDEVLVYLEENNIPWGVVTNKSSWLTDPLMVALKLHDRSACIVSGDTVGHAKPHPAPMLHACGLMKCKPENTVYVGDARRDIEAGRNAGMPTLAAAYGYIPQGEKPEDWEANGIVSNPLEIISWLNLIDS